MKHLNLLPEAAPRDRRGDAALVASVLTLVAVLAMAAAARTAGGASVAATDREIAQLTQAAQLVRSRLDATRRLAEQAAAREREHAAGLAAQARFDAVVSLVRNLAALLPDDVWFDTVEFASGAETVTLRGRASRREAAVGFLGDIAHEFASFRIASASIEHEPHEASFALRLVAPGEIEATP